MNEINDKYKVKTGCLWVSGFSVDYDCSFPVIILVGNEEIAKEIDSKEKAEEIAELVNGVLVSIKCKVPQEVTSKMN